jgi:psp operon transcriptional activator
VDPGAFGDVVVSTTSLVIYTRFGHDLGVLGRIVVFESSRAPQDELAGALRAAAPTGCAVARARALAEVGTAIREGEPLPLILLHEQACDVASGQRGLTLIAALHQIHAELPVVFVSEHDDLDTARRAAEGGALDLLVSGDRLDDRAGTLLAKLRALFEVLERNRRLGEQNVRLEEAVAGQARLVGSSPQMRQLAAQIERVARIPRPLLIQGERGTGKELVARAIHAASDRPAGSMVTVNCAAFGESLLESELFGHERGAFTGADRLRRGKFEQADGGTLFLDEIGHMPLSFQQKILRVVEYGSFTRVGGSGERKTSARVIAATNADLGAKIERGEFLSDLYDRLAFEVIRVAPLRERRGDIEVLARCFLDQFAREIPAFRGKVLSQAAIDVLVDYDFPGNVRELKNIIERSAYRDTTNEITPEDIGMLPRTRATSDAGGFKEQVASFSRGLLEEALRSAKGNRAEAARLLNLSYDQFRHHARKYRV